MLPPVGACAGKPCSRSYYLYMLLNGHSVNITQSRLLNFRRQNCQTKVRKLWIVNWCKESWAEVYIVVNKSYLIHNDFNFCLKRKELHQVRINGLMYLWVRASRSINDYKSINNSLNNICENLFTKPLSLKQIYSNILNRDFWQDSLAAEYFKAKMAKLFTGSENHLLLCLRRHQSGYFQEEMKKCH